MRRLFSVTVIKISDGNKQSEVVPQIHIDVNFSITESFHSSPSSSAVEFFLSVSAAGLKLKTK